MLWVHSRAKPSSWPVESGAIDSEASGLWQKLVLFLPYWDAQALDIEDISGFGLHGVCGTQISNSRWIGSEHGAALHHLGSNSQDAVDIADPSTNLLDGLTRISVEMLVRLSNVTGTKALIGKYFPNPGERSWRLMISGDEFEMQLSSDGTAFQQITTSGVNFLANVWYELVWLFDSGAWSLYSNGKLVASGTSTQTSLNASPSALRIAQRSDALGLAGDVSLVRIWRDRILTASEIEYLYHWPWAMCEPPLLTVPTAAVLHSGGGALPGPWQLAGVSPKAQQELLITGLMNGTSYDVQVKTADQIGNESPGSTILSATPASAAPRPVSLIQPLVSPIPEGGRVRKALR